VKQLSSTQLALPPLHTRSRISADGATFPDVGAPRSGNSAKARTIGNGAGAVITYDMEKERPSALLTDWRMAMTPERLLTYTTMMWEER